MVRRGQKTTFQERIWISEQAEAGKSDLEIAAELGSSVWTVRKWRRLFEKKGRDGLTTETRTPSFRSLEHDAVRTASQAARVARSPSRLGTGEPISQRCGLILLGIRCVCQVVLG